MCTTKFLQNWEGNESQKSEQNFKLECLLLIEVTCKNADFECVNIWTQTKEEPSKISFITFTICPIRKYTQTEKPY